LKSVGKRVNWAGENYFIRYKFLNVKMEGTYSRNKSNVYARDVFLNRLRVCTYLSNL